MLKIFTSRIKTQKGGKASHALELKRVGVCSAPALQQQSWCGLTDGTDFYALLFKALRYL
jgi:hypothetical protein